MPVDRRPYPSLLICGLVFILAGLVEVAHSQRLPGTVIPDNYKLFLDPDISGSEFSGEETIAVQVNSPVNEIVLNSLDLEITQARQWTNRTSS